MKVWVMIHKVKWIQLANVPNTCHLKKKHKLSRPKLSFWILIKSVSILKMRKKLRMNFDSLESAQIKQGKALNYLTWLESSAACVNQVSKLTLVFHKHWKAIIQRSISKVKRKHLIKPQIRNLERSKNGRKERKLLRK